MILMPGLPTMKILRKLISVLKGHAAKMLNKAENRTGEKLNSSLTANSHFDMQCRALSEGTIAD